MNILNHKWGESLAVDRVWAQVSGLRPASAQNRNLMVLQAYIDDSKGADFFVLGGYIASAEVWAKFSEEWESLLPYGLIHRNGHYYFKMSEMALSQDGLERSQAFWRIIESYEPIALSVSFRLSDFYAAQKRFFFSNIVLDWDIWANPYMFAFRALIDMFHGRMDELSPMIDVNEKVDFIFDEQSEKRPILVFRT